MLILGDFRSRNTFCGKLGLNPLTVNATGEALVAKIDLKVTHFIFDNLCSLVSCRSSNVHVNSGVGEMPILLVNSDRPQIRARFSRKILKLNLFPWQLDDTECLGR